MNSGKGIVVGLDGQLSSAETNQTKSGRSG